MKKNSVLARSLAVMLLIVAVAASFAPAAFAYDYGQYYVADYSQTKVFTVQIAASRDLRASEKVRDQMISMGYDCYIYRYNNTYRIMCGKFYSYDDAMSYRASIIACTKYKDAYVNNSWLPYWAVMDFQYEAYWWVN